MIKIICNDNILKTPLVFGIFQAFKAFFEKEHAFVI